MHEGKERPRSNPPLHSERLELKRKLFFLDLYENDHGRFIKITEDVKGRRDTILVPMEVLPEFRDALATIAEVDETVA